MGSINKNILRRSRHENAVTILSMRRWQCLFTLRFYPVYTKWYLYPIRILRLVHRNVIPMGIPWETSHGMGQCHSYGNPMGNIPWDGTAHICISHETV